MGQFAERYRQVAETVLSRPLTPADGIYEGRLRDAEYALGLSLPEAFRDYYLTLSALEGFHTFYCLHQPEELGIDFASRFPSVPIMHEAQGYHYWHLLAEDLTLPDPPVYVECRHPDYVPYGLTAVDNLLSEFLVSLFYRQAAQGGLQYWLYNDVPEAHQSQEIMQNWQLVVQDVERIIWRKGGVLASRPPGENEFPEWEASTNNPADLPWLMDELGFRPMF